MALTNFEKSLPDYKQAVEYVNSTLMLVDPISEDQWKLLCSILFKSDINDLVGCQVQRYVKIEYEDVFWDLYSNFSLFFMNGHSVLKAKLDELYRQTKEPGEKFLQWLLGDCMKQVVLEYRKVVSNERRVKAILQADSKYQKQYINPDKDNNVYAPGSYESDKNKRADNPVQFSRELIVQQALISITRLMSETNWQTKVYFKQPGLQMHPFLQSKEIELESDEFELCSQLKDNVENYVSELHQSRLDFSAASYLAEIHDFASRKFVEKRKRWEERFKITQKNSKNRRHLTKRGINLIADSWLAPLNNELIAQICKVDIRYADQLISRYKKTFLTDIYGIIDNYQEDKDI